MQQVVIIPEQEWKGWMQKQQQLEKEVAYLKKGLSQWVKAEEAGRLGFSRTTLYEMRTDGRLQLGVDYKHEGRSVYYNRTSLESLNEGQKPRRKL